MLSGARRDPCPSDETTCASPERKPVEEGVQLDVSPNQALAIDAKSRSGFGFPEVPPELVACAESPDTCRQRNATCEKEAPLDRDTEEAHTDCLEASFDLACVARNSGDKSGLLSINAGELENPVVCDGIRFQEDRFFVGGDVVGTGEVIGDGRWRALFQTARVGNFAYRFDTLEPGDYIVELRFAEILYTQGPPGLRTFDVFIQEEKVASGLDIFAQVGPNQPLVLSDLKATVSGSGSLVVRFEEVNGKPLVCGLSIRSDPSSSGERSHRPEEQTSFQFGQPAETKAECVECRKIKRDYDLLADAHANIGKALETAKVENEAKGRECDEAWTALQDLQMELVRKSMHVGSLAFAVEGQVKEKTRWFLALRDLSDKVEILKIENTELLEWASTYHSCIVDMETMARTVQSALKDQTDLRRENEELRGKFVKETKVRRELYNKVLEMKGNIRVFCRCRPLNDDEISRGASMVVDFESAKDGELVIRAPKRTFKFDAVFSPEASQDAVFKDTSPLAMSVLDGYNVCIFAYGQTGTGKTFTMEGRENARGVNYKTLEELFGIIEERRDLYRYELSVSVLEVYNEQIRDLLVADSQVGLAAKRLEIRQVSDGEHCIPGVVEAPVSNVNEVWEVLRTGGNARVVGSTNANEHSSRSHCIHRVTVKGENLINGECTRSKLWLIDLAGSERVAKTDAQGERLKEAQCINRSLSALGDVISALATKSPHVPFRNSKLTHLLQDSLGGDSKALMFVQISPSENDASETLCSLNFASRVRGIELGPAKKQFDGSEMSRNKQMLERARQEIKVRDIHIKRMEETMQSMESKVKAKDIANRNLQDKIKELESQLLIERKLARQHIDAKIAEQLQQQKQHIQSQQKEADGLPPTQTQREGAFREISNTIVPVGEDNASSIHDPLLQLATNFPRKLARLKENKPDLAEDPVMRKSSRLSLCPTPRRVAPFLQNSRRNTICPYPTMVGAATTTVTPPPTMMPLAELLSAAAAGGNGEAREFAHGSGEPPRSAKRSNGILRRSLQKKVVVRPVMQQQGRRGLDRLAGPSGCCKTMRARRVPTGKATQTASELLRQKERGWN